MPKKKQTYTLDLKGQCYEIKSLQEGKEEIEAFIKTNISFYGNDEKTYPSPHYKIKVVLEELKDE